MDNLSIYKTITNISEIELIEKKSKFIGRCFPLSTENEALTILDRIRKENWNATHNCFAYILRSGEARYSDDGEPSGTAGMPIIETMKHMGITNALVIVTRFFGGILLGTGGLVRAYSKSASEAITAASIKIMIPCVEYSINVPYSYWNITKKMCEKFGRIEKTEFSEFVNCLLWVKDTETDSFIREITDKTEGRIIPVKKQYDWFPFPESEA